MRLLFVFIDGIGLGKEGPDNLFYLSPTPGLSRILEGNKLTAKCAGFVGAEASLLGLETTLGVPGLPQSATGQASIFTGSNAPAGLGAHLNGFPNHKLRQLLVRKGMFRRLKKFGFQVNFANAYRPPFFDLLRRGLPGNRYSCSTLVTYYGGLPFYGIKDIKNGRALFMDITNELLARLGFDVDCISPEEGAVRLAAISSRYDFCLFEYFLSDLAGHLGDKEEACRVIDVLDRFIGTLAGEVAHLDTMLIVASDHGNLEDLSRRDHTLNNVPALMIGDRELRLRLQPRLKDLTDLFPAFLEALAWTGCADRR